MLEDYLNIEFAIMDKISQPDPMGGVLYTYQEGAHFRGGAVMNNTTEMQLAGQNGAKLLYTLVVDKKLVFSRGQIVRRVEDAADFQLLTDTRDMVTPVKAGIQCAQATMERVVL